MNENDAQRPAATVTGTVISTISDERYISKRTHQSSEEDEAIKEGYADAI